MKTEQSMFTEVQDRKYWNSSKSLVPRKQSRNPKLKQRVDEIVAGLGRAQEALNDDGYLSGFPVSVIANLEKGITQWAFVSFSN